MLQRVTAIIKLWCTEFERNDSGEDAGLSRREAAAIRDGTIKRRGDKKSMFLKEDKVCGLTSPEISLCLSIVSVG